MSDRPNRRGSRSGGPTRTQSDLADVVELLLDKGIVINADIAVSIGDAELLGIQLRAAIASFETAATYGLEFPTGTDTDRIEEIAGANAIDDQDDEEERIDRSQMGKQFMGLHEPPISESSPAMKSAPISGPQDQESENGGLSEAVEEAGSAIAGEDDTYDSGSSEPGVRERPTAPDAAESPDDTESEDDGETSGDVEEDTMDDGSNTSENTATNGPSTDDATEDGENENEGVDQG